MAGGVIWAAAATGTLRGEARGFQRGFNTYNPELHRNDPPAEPVPFDATPDLPIEPPEFPPPVMEVTLTPPPPPPPIEQVNTRGETKEELQRQRRVDLMKLARSRGHGGRWINGARKAEIIDRLMAG